MNRNMEAITWALNARGISPTAFRLLINLCSHVNSNRDDFEVWPSHKRMAEAVEISTSGVKRHLQELVDAGYLEVRPGQRLDGGRSSNVYSISVRTQHEMPKGRIVQIEPSPVQSDLGPQFTGDLGPQFTADLCNEPLEERTSERKNNPPLPTEEPPLRDLLGEIVPADSRCVDLIDYVQAEWAKLAEQYPRIQNIRVLNDARMKKIRARAHDITKHANGKLTAHDVWDQIFAAIRVSPFLRGDAEPGKNYSAPFSLSIDYITRPSVFLNTLERASIDAERNRHTHSLDGRRYGPAEQAMHEVLASMGLS